MKVYKFGGASVKDANGVRNLHKIISNSNDNLVVVVSAMGKMTNALELVVNSFFNHKSDTDILLKKIVDFHESIISDLFGSHRSEIDNRINALYDKINAILSDKPSLSYDYEYDRIVSFGELISTTIVSCYLNYAGLKTDWIDIRDCIITDSNHRDANVNIELSSKFTKAAFKGKKIAITQGFIAGTTTNQTTTLGREGSDYSAAILANLLDTNHSGTLL